MNRAKPVTGVAATCFITGAVCAVLAAGAFLPLLIPDGRYGLCVEIDYPIVTVHDDPAACARPPEASTPDSPEDPLP